eukprot:GHVT01073006.1.p1 GENE.GHVT01073006.1~~GHVT01073006.1.p1  ORF type:complete len:742 (+),score=236.44 GHVT01073006.1:561-2786(+)
MARVSSLPLVLEVGPAGVYDEFYPTSTPAAYSGAPPPSGRAGSSSGGAPRQVYVHQARRACTASDLATKRYARFLAVGASPPKGAGRVKKLGLPRATNPPAADAQRPVPKPPCLSKASSADGRTGQVSNGYGLPYSLWDARKLHPVVFPNQPAADASNETGRRRHSPTRHEAALLKGCEEPALGSSYIVEGASGAMALLLPRLQLDAERRRIAGICQQFEAVEVSRNEKLMSLLRRTDAAAAPAGCAATGKFARAKDRVKELLAQHSQRLQEANRRQKLREEEEKRRRKIAIELEEKKRAEEVARLHQEELRKKEETARLEQIALEERRRAEAQAEERRRQQEREEAAKKAEEEEARKKEEDRRAELLRKQQEDQANLQLQQQRQQQQQQLQQQQLQQQQQQQAEVPSSVGAVETERTATASAAAVAPEGSAPSPSWLPAGTPQVAQALERRRWLATLEAEELKGIRDSKEPEVRRLRIETKKKLTAPLNHVASTHKSIKLAALSLMKELDTLQRASKPTIFRFGLFSFVDVLLRQCEPGGQIFTRPSACWAYANLMQMVGKAFSPVVQFFESLMCNACPYVVPMVPAKPPGMTMAEFRAFRGQWASEDDGAFGDRMGAFVRLYLSWKVATLRPQELWTWMARLLNLKQRRISVVLLVVALETAGNTLLVNFKGQFHKVLMYIQTSFIPRFKILAAKHPGLKVALEQLVMFLNKYEESNRTLAPSEGQAIPENSVDVSASG